MKTVNLIFLIVSIASLNCFASDAERIARALEDRLSDALDFDNSRPNNVHKHTKLRRFEDGNPMWMQLFVRPAQNKNFYQFYGKGFKTGRSKSLYTNINDISRNDTFQMRHESPWSYKFSGIGKFFFYRKKNFQNKFYERVSSNDRPKLFTFGSNNNAKNCRCSSQNPNCNRGRCGHREKIGSIKFCPGVSLYEKAKYIGSSFTYVKCDPKPARQYCYNVENGQRKSQSFHFDALIKEVHFYTSKNCQGDGAWYSFRKQEGTVSQISSKVSNKIKSLKIVFKDAR